MKLHRDSLLGMVDIYVIGVSMLTRIASDVCSRLVTVFRTMDHFLNFLKIFEEIYLPDVYNTF